MCKHVNLYIRCTASSEAIASDDASLNNGILLAGKGQDPEPQFGQEASPRLDQEETQQPSGNIQGRYDCDRETQLVGDDAEEATQQGTHYKPSNGDLVLPFRNRLVGAVNAPDPLSILEQRLCHFYCGRRNFATHLEDDD